MTMTSKQRLITAIEGGKPDRLPVTTHHVMPYFLKTYMNGMSNDAFLDYFGFDPILWTVPHRPDESNGDFFHPEQEDPGFLGSRFIISDNWRIAWEEISDPQYQTTRYRFITPKGELTMVLQTNQHTSWVSEYLIKEKHDIDLIGEYATSPWCDVATVNRAAEDFGQRGLVRGHICCFDVFGQPGTWQDAACLVGIEKLIMAAFDDPQWVHQLLRILQNRKRLFVESLAGAKYDILELGGGDGSSTVISPKLFDEFVAPYDTELIAAAHAAGQRIVYHTCGGMMPILDHIVAMNPDAMETFTPPGMGGDADLAKARKRIPQHICMIGGFDQFHFFQDGTPEQTADEVRRCFEAAGKNGGYILSPSDHFFDAQPELLQAFTQAARQCSYE